MKNVRIAYDFKKIQDGKENNFIKPNEWTLDIDKNDEQMWIAPQLSNLWFSLYIEDDFEITIADTIFISTTLISDLNLSKSIITSWNVLNNDSLEYINAFACEDACGAVSKIEYNGKFPDSSNFLITSTSYRGVSERCAGYFFFKEVEDQYFVLFHSIIEERPIPYVTINTNNRVFKQSGVHKKPELIMDNLKNNNFRIFKKNQFHHMNPITVDGVTHFDFILDSIHIEPIDLWELAKKHFNIVEE